MSELVFVPLNVLGHAFVNGQAPGTTNPRSFRHLAERVQLLQALFGQ